MNKQGKIAIDNLIKAGYSAYYVGGCVRDYIMGQPYADIDIATNAHPEQVAKCFSKVINTGIDYGTVTVIIDDVAMEITTFRKDLDYIDGRRPIAVNYSETIEEDLARRDFTINAIALSASGELIDPFSGQSDIERGIIRCVGNPIERFKEDKLRKLRAIRFACQKNFKLDDTVYQALVNDPCLKGVSGERIFDELNKILLSNRPSLGLENLMLTGLLSEIDVNLQAMVGFDQKNPNHIHDVFYHTLNVVDSIPKDSVLRWAALLHDIGKPKTFTIDEKGIGHFYGHQQVSCEIANEIFDKFNVGMSFREQVCGIIFQHMSHPVLKDKAVRRWMAKIGPSQVDNMLVFMEADRMGKRPKKDNYMVELRSKVEIEKNKIIPFSRKQLEIDGNVLMKEIPMLRENRLLIGEILDEMVKCCIDNPELNSRSQLLKLSKDFYNNIKEKGV